MGLIDNINILDARVMHHRLKPKQNKFLYSIYYLSLPFKSLDKKGGNWLLGFNRTALLSFYAKDHGDLNQSLMQWIGDLLQKANVSNANMAAISLITIPRIFGYAFNPISFWIVPDENQNVLAVICEVNNTFGERHTYVCVHSEGKIIKPSDVLETPKIFHVSPFLEREGFYKFRFSFKENFFAAFIDYIDVEKYPMLLTSVSGKMKPASVRNLLLSFIRYPVIPLKVIFLIHWQAAIIFLKGINYVPKPQPKNDTHSIAKTN